MNKKAKKYIKMGITIAIIVLCIWFVILSPWLTFKKYEKTMLEAGKRYFEINQANLPTGNRVKTVNLQKLYYKAYVKEDFYIPYTKEPCSVTESWVKVKKAENGEYKYYTYLKCGMLTSNVDHKGPSITLNGKSEVTVNKGDKYKDAGVSSVIDNKDGKMNTSDVTIKSNVNTQKVGTYTVTYTATDSLSNKTTVTRKIKVVEPLKNAVKEATSKVGYYSGANPNNYIYFSGMLFRIVGLDGDNVKIIANEDVANINYDGIEKWLDNYYYDHLTSKAKKLIVKNRYCNMNLTDTTLDTTECTSYTKERNSYIISAPEINKATTNEGNYLKPVTMSWLANKKDNENAYITRSYFFESDQNYLSYTKEFNFGIRPVLTIKGDTLIKSGNGTIDEPYSLGDFTSGKVKDLINTRFSGEYINYSGMLWRIIETNEDGTTKIIATETLRNNDEKIEYYYIPGNKTIYNPKEKGNIGYNINNRGSEYIDTSYLVNHEIEVPIYKTKIKYGEEIKKEKYKVKLSAPNMYEMFTAYTTTGKANMLKSHWLVNSSQEQNVVSAMTDIGVIINDKIEDYDRYGIRVVGYLNKNVAISNGKGTAKEPYVISK